ncbi:LysR family transcriptional regulator [Aerococcus agrisoli]|uniref:LysR family transcriptional regulator n=1 Tax=Aerococcus agrisoli TaxID=2487350 RepID=A0A3N4GRU4_9LACT|nr:LysR family transcriptional regulator [Aerococcus agrisoli]RPA65532.1 LysR family transcriptional regulator [Aerococcus agrisoli]
MNIQDLIYFNDLAKTLNYTETAHNFFVSQPTISLAVKRLEEEFDTNLFNRQRFSKGMTITETGELLLDFSNRLVLQLAATKQKIRDTSNNVVSFGFLPTIGGALWPRFIPQVKKASPDIHFYEEESSDVMFELVKTGEVPIAIVGHDKPNISDESIQQTPILKEAFTLWTKADHPLAKKSFITPADLKGETLLSLSQGYTHQRIFHDWLAANHLEDEVTLLYTKEIRTALSIASTSHMLAFMSPIIADRHLDLVQLTIENAPKFYISLVVNTAEQYGHNQRIFNEEMADIASDLYEQFSALETKRSIE